MKPKITLYSELYMEIYESLRKTFLKKEWEPTRTMPGKKFGVWFKQDKDGKYVVTELFGPNPKYFYNHNGQAKNGENIGLEADELMKVLKYIDCKGETIDVLLQSFYKRNNVNKRIIRKQEMVNSEKILEKNPATSNTNISYIQGDTVYNYFPASPEMTDPSGPEAIVYRFYEKIGLACAAGYEEGWHCLSESFQTRIWGREGDPDNQPGRKYGVERFKEGYHFFRGLKETHVFNMKVNGNRADGMVYYESDLELPHIEELADINKISIRNVAVLVEKVEALTRTIDSFGGTGFANKGLVRLFYTTPTETIWFEHGLDPVKFKAAYPNMSMLAISNLLRCRCVRINDEWFIDGLIPFHCRRI